jgi:hypothetical protein
VDKVWTGKKLKMSSCGLLRDAGGGRRNTFTAGNGYHPGGFSGTRERPGNRNLQRVPGTGGRRVAPGSPGNRANRMASLGNWANRTGSLDNRANRNSEAGRPVDLDR